MGRKESYSKVPKFYYELQILLSNFLNILYQLGAGTMVLKDLIDVNKPTPSTEEIHNFFMIMEVYGARPLNINEE